MQTFLPYPDFTKSAEALDYRRLGKQRVEAWQILNTLLTNKKAWSNHPAVLMWKGHELALANYGMEMCIAWKNLGYKDIMFERFSNIAWTNSSMPPWFGNPGFHASHRSNLLRKDPVYYGKFNWTEPNNLEYVWPITKDKANVLV